MYVNTDKLDGKNGHFFFPTHETYIIPCLYRYVTVNTKYAILGK